LYEDKAYYEDVVEIFKNDIDEKTNNTIQVILNKAINALRVFGIKIVKCKNQYHLESSLYSLKYNLNDLKSISIFINSIKNFPDDKTKDSVSEFLENISLRMDNMSKKTLNTFTTNFDFSFFYKDLKDQINLCKEFCASETKFDITYIKNGKEYSTVGIAHDITFDTKNAYLHMYDKKNNLRVEVPLTNILKLVSAHSKGIAPGNATTITFKLTGRLAKTYSLKEGETLINTDDEGNKIIANRNEDLDKFLSRMMRYSDCCQIIAPKTIKQEMKELINETIAQYE
jgi:hypothetical protein